MEVVILLKLMPQKVCMVIYEETLSLLTIVHAKFAVMWKLVLQQPVPQ